MIEIDLKKYKCFYSFGTYHKDNIIRIKKYDNVGIQYHNAQLTSYLDGFLIGITQDNKLEIIKRTTSFNSERFLKTLEDTKKLVDKCSGIFRAKFNYSKLIEFVTKNYEDTDKFLDFKENSTFFDKAFYDRLV